MPKRIFTHPQTLFLLLCSCVVPLLWAGGPPFQEVISHSDSNETFPEKNLVRDGAGNIYLTGNYNGTANFGALTLTSTSVLQEIYVVKLDADGLPTWAQRGFSSSGSGIVQVSRLAVDEQNRVYITGIYQDLMEFTGTSGNLTFGQPGLNLFVVRFDTDGNPSLITTSTTPVDAPPNSGAMGMEVAVDSVGNVYVRGSATGQVTIGPGMLLDVGANVDLFLAKYSSTGTPLWAKLANSSHVDLLFNGDMVVDGNGNLYVAGVFYNSLNWSGNQATNSLGGRDGYLARFSGNGDLVWINYFASPQTEIAHDLAVDDQNNIYVAGNYAGSATLQSQNGNHFNLTTAGNSDAFFVKYTPSGNGVWVETAGGPLGEVGKSIDVYESAVYAAGYFRDTTSFFSGFDQHTYIAHPSLAPDGFLAKFDLDGNPKWVKPVAGPEFDGPPEIVGGAEGKLYVASYYDQLPPDLGLGSLPTSAVRRSFFAILGDAILVSPTAGLITDEDGGQDAFTVKLTAQPSDTVTLNLSSSDTMEGTIDPATLVFTSQDWDQPKQVTVTGQADGIGDGNVPYTIDFAPSVSNDTSFSGIVGDSVSVTNLDNESPQLVITPQVASENDANAIINVSRSLALGNLDLNYETLFQDGSVVGQATSTTDYQLETMGNLNFRGQQDSLDISIPLIQDDLVEGNETFAVRVFNTSLGLDFTTIVTIIDDEGPPVMSIADASAAEGTDLDFAIQLSHGFSADATLTYSTLVHGSNPATPGDGLDPDDDYILAVDETLLIPAGTTTANIPIPTYSQNFCELDETLKVVIVGVDQPHVLSDGTGIGTIEASDLGSVEITATGNKRVDEGNSFDLDVTLNGSCDDPVTVEVRAVNIDTDNNDYSFPSQLITFLPGGPTTYTVTLTALCDGDNTEGNEDVDIQIYNPVRATISNNKDNVTVTIQDTACLP